MVTHSQKVGQGLLEAIVAIGIILIGLGAVLTLALKNVVATTTSSQRIVASHLAREALELVRARRDSNWLKAANTTPEWLWDCGLIPTVNPGDVSTCNLNLLEPGNSCFINNPNNCGVSINFEPGSFPDFNFYYHNTRNVDDLSYDLTMYRGPAGDNYYWTQQNTALISTNYRRLLVLDPVCQDGGVVTVRTNQVACLVGETKIGIKAEAKVSWLQSGLFGTSRRSVVLTEYIYNWR